LLLIYGAKKLPMNDQPEPAQSDSLSKTGDSLASDQMAQPHFQI
jgi:hypothetical protein